MGLELYAEIEPLLGFDEAIEALHESYIQILESWQITSLLDIGCGSGKFLANAQKRLDLTRSLGIDLSEKMVEAAQMKGVEAKAIDLCRMKEELFDAATAVFDVLNYIPPSELKRFMNCAADTLRSGGLFIADVNTLFGFEEVAQGSLVRRSDDYHLTLDSIFEESVMRTHIDYFTRSDEIDNSWHRASDTIVQYYHPIETLASACERLELIQSYPLRMYAEEADKEILVFKRV